MAYWSKKTGFISKKPKKKRYGGPNISIAQENARSRAATQANYAQEAASKGMTPDEYTAFKKRTGGSFLGSYRDQKAGVSTPKVDAKVNDFLRQKEAEALRAEATREFNKEQIKGELQKQQRKEEYAGALPSNIQTKDIQGKPIPDVLLEQGTAAGAGLTSGIAGGVSAAALATKFGVAGSVAGPLGAAAGVLVGLGTYGAKLSYDKRQDTKEAFNDFNNAKQGVSEIITDTTAQRIDPFTAREYYDNEWANIYQAEARLKKLTDTAWGRSLSQAMDELADVQKMIEKKELYDAKFEYAILNPTELYNPAA